MQNLALYIHWPFCKKKCPYCDFNSHVREEVDHTRYRRALLTELRHMHSLMPDAALSSIFFGGGTPSLMHPDTTAALIDEAKALWPAQPLLVERRSAEQEVNAEKSTPPELEITLEANPTSVEAGRFAAFRDAGINRLSLGIQSLRPEALSFLGREHSAEEALAALAIARTYFDRYSFDLIYALPHQTPSAWESELREALHHAGDHLSLYQLTIEPNTAFHTAYFGKKAFTLPDESTAATLYERTQAIMEEAGLPAYEISNHARAGQASRHNLSYWRSDAYIGIGPGAHGRVSVTGRAEQSAKRSNGEASLAPPASNAYFATRTYKTPERWVEIVERDGHAIEEMTPITPEERMEEKLLMGLRLAEGLPLARFTPEERAHLDARINMRSLAMLEQTGLLTRTPTHWHITAKGKLVLNSIIETLLA
ncbi:MAG: coproporphyrinogen III oxidase [Alphaproteobacteria bacterium]|nr:coproporphyrinogen III oxidase [Alphaproteobacteria bacterium]